MQRFVHLWNVIVVIELHGRPYTGNLAEGTDLSLPVHAENGGIRAFGLGPVEIEPFRVPGFTGSVKEGGSANCDLLSFYPHGNCTHTESIGHITPEQQSVNGIFSRYWFSAALLSIEPEARGEDRVISKAQLEAITLPRAEALIIRTLPNTADKKERNYSDSNPPYFEPAALAWAAEKGFWHLLCDLPSVDRESDGGKMAAHKAWWQYPEQPRLLASITELIYVPDHLNDGFYLLNLQVAPIVDDAAPSRPVLYALRPL